MSKTLELAADLEGIFISEEIHANKARGRVGDEDHWFHLREVELIEVPEELL